MFGTTAIGGHDLSVGSGLYLEGWWSPDQSKVLFVVPEGSYQSYGGGGPLDLFTLGASGATDSCHQLVSDSVVAAGFSPDGAFIYWVVRPPTGERSSGPPPATGAARE